MPVLGAPSDGAPIEVPPCDSPEVGADGIGVAVGAGVGAAGVGAWVLLKPAKFMREPAAAGAACGPADGGGVGGDDTKSEVVPVAEPGTPEEPVVPVAEPETPGELCPSVGGDACGGVSNPDFTPNPDPGLLRTPLTCSSRFFSSPGWRNICPISRPCACANPRADCPGTSASRTRCIASTTLPDHFAAAMLASVRP